MGTNSLTSSNRRAEDIGVFVIVVAKLKLRNVKRNIFGAGFVERAERSGDSTFNAEYRPKRIHRVTTGLDPVVTPGV